MPRQNYLEFRWYVKVKERVSKIEKKEKKSQEGVGSRI